MPMPGPAADDQDAEPPDEPDAEPDIEHIVVAGARRRRAWYAFVEGFVVRKHGS